MLIIKDKNYPHDYYDSVLKATGVDNTVVYNRTVKQYEIEYFWEQGAKVKIDESKTINFDFPRFNKVERHKRNLERYLIGFCGETHLLVKEIFNPDESDEKIVWSYDPSPEEYKEIKDRYNLYSFFDRKKSNNTWKKFPAQLFLTLNSPVIMLNQQILTVNTNLNELQFYRVKDHYTAYQEIYNYISGVLGKSEKEIIEVSDKDKLTGHGFDSKTSFRHPVKL